ncbi:DNA polymerase alpha subunit B isoform X1 [Carcharodon carcharias]|uniref:DNA polymerase alpha subunit B isoform X1 n=1 Tax=Carcharodon carcharias TaxID=13397 RepID=UPI001B7EE807|nr:DNA polymerase alpha subunit B isoform X1 [Carcharodon carcharias]
MRVNVENIVSEMETFDLVAEDDSVLEKLLEHCITYRLKEEGIVHEWFAFSATRGGIALNADNVEIFEHEILSKKAKSRPATVRQNNRTPMQDLNTLEQLVRAETEEENLLDSYTTVPKAGSQKRVLTTPEQPQSKKVLIARSPRLLFSPASFSPSANPSQKYSSRANRGEVVASFGTAQGATWHGMGGRSASVQLLAVPEDSITKRFKYMFQKLRDVRDVLNDRIEELSQVLTDHYDIEDFRSVAMPAQEPVTFLGQIACDSNGKLNAKSVILQGDLKHSAGMQVPVDLSDLKDYSLFPGQVVALDGTNSTGRRVVASRLYEGVPLPFYQPEKQSEQEEAFEGLEQQMVLVACGPYTTSDSITYDPMMDLIDVINRDQPDICILLGPFVDSKHEQIENCQLTVTFQEVFKQCMKGIIEGTRGSGSHLVFVPSLRDVHHDFVYPQPPFHCFEPLKEDKERVHFVSDPCTLNINGVVFGVTSTDVLFHMGTEEINSPPGGSDRFTRILKHILTQRSYYPLYPPAEEMNIDYECFQLYAQIPVTPDVLIVPSELRYFIKDVLGCICINPGRLTKGQVGGTYGRLLLQKWNSKEAHRQTPCMATQVVKI